MLRRLFIVLQSFCSIPFIIFLFVWITSPEYGRWGRTFYVVQMCLLSLTPYGLVIIGKWIIYGKFYIFKIGEGEENKLRDSSRKDDSKNSNQDFDDPPFPDGF